MPSLGFKVKYKKNQGIALSSSELIEGFLFGIPLTNAQGVTISQSVIESKIRFAQEQIENTLSLKLGYQEITEDKDFIGSEYASWGFLKLGFPVKKVLSLTGNLGEGEMTKFPIEWCSINHQSEERLMGRTVSLIPNGRGNIVSTRNYVGIFPQLSLLGVDSIPNYWKIKYLTGYNKAPYELIEFIGKLASIQILSIVGNLILSPGVTSQSLSFDGLSQSVSTSKSSSSTAYSATIKQYLEELKNALPTLINVYKGISFTTL